MFNRKLTNLFPQTEKQNRHLSDSKNMFLNEGLKQGAKTLSGNLSVKYSTTGDDFLDQFGKLGNYRQPRSFEDICRDMDILWGQDKRNALSLALYIRLITRKVQFNDGEKTRVVQRGQGLKHEGIMRMIWIAVNEPKAFWDNLDLCVAAGSWKDIFQMLSFDLQHHGWDKRVLDWDKFADVIEVGLANPNTSDLIKKYLPQIKANSKCTTVASQANNMIAKFLCSRMFGNKSQNKETYKRYRSLKTSGTAHQWQQAISRKQMNALDFGKVHGRALALLTGGKFLANQGLEKEYEKWIMAQPVAKYTGYVYELMKGIGNCCGSVSLKPYQEMTINKQFMGLVEQAKQDIDTSTRYIVCMDTSGSMGSTVHGTDQSAYDIGKSLALYFSYLLEGHFKDAWIEFHSTARLKKWKGTTPVKRLQNDTSSYVGSTNIQGVAKIFADLKRRGIDENEFPTGIICISDGEFNRTGEVSNVDTFKLNLARAGFSPQFVQNFTFIFWDMPNNYYYGDGEHTKFETYGDHSNVFYMAGFDGAGLGLLFGDKENPDKAIPKSADELLEAALTQELMQKVML